MKTYPIQAPMSGVMAALAPTAPTSKGLWVDEDGNTMAAAGARGRGVAYQNFSATDVTNTSAYPPARLPVITFGPAKVILGATVGDKKFVTTDAAGKTIEAATAGHEQLAWIEIGGDDGEEREVFVLASYDGRVPSAAIADAVAITGGESPTEAEYNLLVTKINAIITALEAQKVIAP